MASTTAFADGPGVVIIADNPAAEALALRAVAEAGGRVLATVGWSDARTRLNEQAAPAIVLIETAGVADDVVASALGSLVAMAGAERAIVTFAPAALDMVGAALLGTEATLLCRPTMADRITALALVMAARDLVLRDSGNEASRLARINQEVARFTAALSRLTSADPDGPAGDGGAIVGDRRMDFGQPHAPPGDEKAEALRRAIRARRMRDDAFGSAGLFEDPAWDMMLDLYAAELEGRAVSVSSLCIAAAVAPTTALRWISKLIAIGLFDRRPDTFDRRRAFVVLTPQGSKAMRDYLLALRRAGLTLA